MAVTSAYTLSEAREQLQLWKDCEKALSSGQAKAYRVGTREYTAFDLAEIAKRIEHLYMGEDSTGRVYDDYLINNQLNKNGIASAAYVGGRWAIWGCHSADYSYEGGNQINVSETNRMMLYYISNDFQHRRTRDVDKPLTANDIKTIVAEEQTRLDALVKIGALTYGVVHLNAEADARSDIMNGDYSFTFNVTTTPLAKSLTAIVNWTDEGFVTYFADVA